MAHSVVLSSCVFPLTVVNGTRHNTRVIKSVSECGENKHGGLANVAKKVQTVCNLKFELKKFLECHSNKAKNLLNLPLNENAHACFF